MPSSVYITLIFWSLLCLPCRACNQVPQRRIHQHWGLCRLGGFVTVRLFEKDYPLVGGPSFAPLHKAVVVSLEETAETSRETAETAQEGGRETDARSRVLQFDVIPLQPKEPVVLAKLLSGTTLKGEMRHRTFPRVPPGSRLLVERRIDIQPGISQLEERLQSAALLWDLSFNFYFRNCLHFCDYMLLQLLLICGDDSKLSRDKEGERAHGEIDERLGDGGAVRLEWSSRKLWPDRVMSLTWWRKFIWEGRLKGYRETRLDANVFVDREDGRGQGRKRKVRLGQLGVKVVREGGLRGEFLEESFQQSFPDEWQRKTAGQREAHMRFYVIETFESDREK
uniref:DUF4105 domain-containing protein n=1 Tax=Chromera velia CCMP2878 TaxID=1169474 RepID=A0A0K6S6V7_9ALVE|eukprot:Cvel_413.t2-p1 / transcript=Cvel_413.t2 / gene=Cvel_413 / organism=Chromera_velia_CCMP2878 / gene_product=hypothetical protein / transcript_product=hypothetical protein / location=Cvel_scaffold13:128797-129807(+) / protein_length=337 / sequence_SO=supercontig / SO=protein_coding / is_pseudo=false